MNREVLAAHFREQSGFCAAFGSRFTAELIDRMGDDFEAGGPVAEIVGAWPTHPRKDALSLRLAGALHFATLSGRDPALAAVYPVAVSASAAEGSVDAAAVSDPDTGSSWEMDAVWPLARAFFIRESAWAKEFIASAPQTNETRRSIALLAGFLTIADAHPGPIDTLEIGASAGLNLYWDRFAYRTGSWEWGGPSRVRIETDWRADPPPSGASLRVRHRRACDLQPLDIADPTERLRLRAYLWADQPERLARFDAAADVAIEAGVRVERADAAEWLAERLAERAADGTTVVYHSVFLQYPPREVREKIVATIESAGARATADAPLAWLRMEPEATLGGPIGSIRMLLDVVMWPPGARRILGRPDPHLRFFEPPDSSEPTD